jgi:Mn-dependent DtxR family transcriptional regulator
MITNTDLAQRDVKQTELTDRQRQALTLIEDYYRVAHEAPSYGWLARRLGVSRQTAVEYIGALRRKGWLGR